ncbi:MAG TPA: dihydroxyacetone kinase family protein [Propionibacteriaceae bacterium]|nr:dihydroxyacetone kinase family protein [Propionibacteriaceae bacterium]
MTFLVNSPADFADEALAGMVAANPRYLRPVHGGVVRASKVPDGQVGVVIGGGSGHYPAFAGWVGPGLATGAACGNIFASPSASQIYSVLKASDRGAGVFVSFGNYAGDVLHFGEAADKLRAEGVDVRIVTVSDDIASAPADHALERRGIAGDLVIFKCAAAAAEAGADLDEVERVARLANDRTRSFGIAFSGCTLPGADHPLFTVPEGQMSLGLGIHGEPGIAEQPIGTADEIAELLVDKVVAEDPGDSTRILAMVNGLGTVKYEELFVTYAKVAELLRERGYEIVEAEVDEQCTSLDMAGLSLTLCWFDDELERLWCAPCDTPAYRKGSVDAVELDDRPLDTVEDDVVPDAAPASRAAASLIAQAITDVHAMLAESEAYLGDIDAVAGDGDHGIGMSRGAAAADETAQDLLARGAGASTLLQRVAEAWSERAGGTSGALWGAALRAAGRRLDDQSAPSATVVIEAAVAAVDEIVSVGGAEPGDKTMVDAALPFRDALRGSDQPLPAAWAEAVAAAEQGAEATASIAAKRGRARTHHERSIGTPDPGAVSFSRIVAVVGRRLAGH